MHSLMLPWKLRKRQILPVNQNFSSVYFSLAKILQMTYTHKLPKLCSATLNLFREVVVGNSSTRDLGRSGYETTSSLSERGLTHRSSSSSSSHHQHISFPIHDSARLSVFSKSRSNELTMVDVSFLKALSLHSTHTQVNSLS